MLNRTFFFVGYGLKDPNFRQIYSRITRMLAKASRPAYATTFETAGGAGEHLMRQWANKRLNLIGVPGAWRDEQEQEFLRFLDRLADHVTLHRPRLLLTPDVPPPGPLAEIRDAWRSRRARTDGFMSAARARGRCGGCALAVGGAGVSDAARLAATDAAAGPVPGGGGTGGACPGRDGTAALPHRSAGGGRGLRRRAAHTRAGGNGEGVIPAAHLQRHRRRLYPNQAVLRPPAPARRSHETLSSVAAHGRRLPVRRAETAGRGLPRRRQGRAGFRRPGRVRRRNRRQGQARRPGRRGGRRQVHRLFPGWRSARRRLGRQAGRRRSRPPSAPPTARPPSTAPAGRAKSPTASSAVPARTASSST